VENEISKNAIINVRQCFYLEGKEFKEEDWVVVAHKRKFDGV